MPISTDFTPEGDLELWEFGSRGRRRIAERLEPDQAVKLLEAQVQHQEVQAAIRKGLEVPEPPGGPYIYKIVEYVETRKVWEP